MRTSGRVVLWLFAAGLLIVTGPNSRFTRAADAARGVAADAGASTRPATRPSAIGPGVQHHGVARVSGRVNDEAGRPVAGALVEVHPTGSPRCSSRTASDGTFSVNAEVGYDRTGARLRASNSDGTRQGLHKAVLDQASPVEGIVIVLRPAREFAANVVDGRGRPVEGTWVTGFSDYTLAGEATTDAAGKATLRCAADEPLRYVMATKPDVGLDYFSFALADRPRTEPYQFDTDFAAPLSFVLNGVKPVTIRVVDDQKRPLPGVSIYPWFFSKPRKGNIFNTSVPEFHGTTDERGIAEFHMVPADNDKGVDFHPRLDGYCAPKRCVWKPEAGQSVLETTMLRQVRMTGRVVDASGQCVAGARVSVGGDNFEIDPFHREITTDGDGRFELDVDPEMFYIAIASRDRDVSPAAFQLVRMGAAPPPLLLTLEPGTRVFGRVTAGPESAPLAAARVTLTRRADREYYNLPKDQQLPGGVLNRKSVSPSVFEHATTSGDGEFEFYVSSGQVQLNVWPTGGSPQSSSLNLSQDRKTYTLYRYDQTHLTRNRKEETHEVPAGGIETNFNLESANPTPKLLKGRVVLADNPSAGVAEAKLEVRLVPDEPVLIEGVSDRQGNFTIRRGSGKGELHLGAVSPDGKLRGISVINPGQDDVSVPLGPTASARGRLLDDQGEVQSGRTVEYGVHVGLPNGAFSVSYGGNVKTAADGTFLLGGLVPGNEYGISVVNQVDEDGRAHSWLPVGKVKPQRVERVELGDLKLPKPYRPKTVAEYTADAFSKKEPIDARLQHAKQIATLDYQHVLVLLGAPDRPACRQFYEYRNDLENSTVAEALADYVLVPVDVRTSAADAKARAEARGIAWPEAGMTLAVLDMDGRLVTQTSDEALSVGGKLSATKLIEFAKAHAPVKPDAQKLFDDALARAKREGKHVLFEQSGAYCGWCVRLAEYVHANQELFDKDFVFVAIDPRFKGGKEVIERFRTKREGGIPWMAILDSGGNVVINSDGPAGNIGYPGEEGSGPHWEKMLRAGATRLTDAEIQTLVRNARAPAAASRAAPTPAQ